MGEETLLQKGPSPTKPFFPTKPFPPQSLSPHKAFLSHKAFKSAILCVVSVKIAALAHEFLPVGK